MKPEAQLKLEFCARHCWCSPKELKGRLLEVAIEELYQKLLAGWVAPLPDPKKRKRR